MAGKPNENPLLELLLYVIGMFDPYGKDHSKRVSALALELAARHNLTDQQINDLWIAALLHDVGKLGIPESIRRTPGRFTIGERIVMQQHASMGVELLRIVSNGFINQNVLAIVRHHHENWNGTGYPDGLAGETIPIGARIVRICDFFDALTNVRGYSNARGSIAALQLMREEQVFSPWADPSLFENFQQLIRERSEERS